MKRMVREKLAGHPRDPIIRKSTAGARRAFETVEFCAAEDATRARKIQAEIAGRVSKKTARGRKKARAARKAARALLRALKLGLRSDEPQPTLASSLYMREVRATVIGALLEAVDPFPDADIRAVTVINTAWRLSAAQLMRTSAAGIKNQFRTYLQRAGILALPGFVVAFLHGEFEPTSGCFQLHFHVLTTAEKAAAILKSLRGRLGYVRTTTGAAAIKRSKIRNRSTQFSYLLKCFGLSARWSKSTVVSGACGRSTALRVSPIPSICFGYTKQP